MSGHRPLRRRAIFAICAVAFGVLGWSDSSAAQTVNDIVSKGKITIGIIVDFPPFGFMNADQKPDGFDVEFARLIAKNLGVEPELVPVDSANRVPNLVTKRVDILVASLGITPDRAKQVLFTIPYAATVSEVIAPKSKTIKQLSDLSGLTIGAGRATSNDIFITQFAPKDAQIMRFQGDGAAGQALLSGQVDALAFTNTMANELIRNNPQLNLEPKLVLRAQSNGIAVRKDATELRDWLNVMIYYVKADGELDTMYRKWIGGPLPELPVF
jgi:polar amino acid transport system substrate-binding protein